MAGTVVDNKTAVSTGRDPMEEITRMEMVAEAMGVETVGVMAVNKMVAVTGAVASQTLADLEVKEVEATKMAGVREVVAWVVESATETHPCLLAILAMRIRAQLATFSDRPALTQSALECSQIRKLANLREPLLSISPHPLKHRLPVLLMDVKPLALEDVSVSTLPTANRDPDEVKSDLCWLFYLPLQTQIYKYIFRAEFSINLARLIYHTHTHTPSGTTTLFHFN